MFSNDRNQSSQPLELSSSVWIVIACVVAVGIWLRTREQDADPAVSSQSTTTPIIRRLSGDCYRFPYLGFEVCPPAGWWHLSVVDPTRSSAPIFVNQDDQSIVLLRHVNEITWTGDLSDLPRVQYGEIGVQWLEIPPQQFTMSVGSGQSEFSLEWKKVRFRHIGRLSHAGLRYWIMIISERAQPTENVAKLLESIHF